jgi:hypothetical protein
MNKLGAGAWTGLQKSRSALHIDLRPFKQQHGTPILWQLRASWINVTLTETAMNGILRHKVCFVLFAFCTGGLVSVASAEKIDVKFTKNARAMYAETKMNPDGAAGREIARYFYVDQINMSQGLDFVEERGHDRDDQIEGSGTHSGTAVDTLKDGDEIYQTFSGIHKTTTKANGSWEVNYHGVSIITGGTGPYKNAKGKLNYKGRITQDSFHEEDEGHISF